jgi:hypothetical protein
VGGIALAGVTWSEHIITVPLPADGNGSYGDVTVKSRGHLSNVAQLTRWVLPVTYFRYGPGSLTQQIDLSIIIRGDAGTYRMTPFAAPIGLPHSVGISKASTGSWLMSGIHQPDPDHFTKWKGTGTLKGARTNAEATELGFMWALGNINPGARTIGTFTPTAQMEYTIEKENGESKGLANLAPFYGLTLSYNTSYVIKADSIGPVSSGGGSAKMRWGPAAPDAPFNNGGRIARRSRLPLP